MASPWRFSSAVHLRVHCAQAVSLAPVSSRVPSSVFSMLLQVGTAASERTSAVRVPRQRSAHVGGQRLLRDHVANEDQQVLVRDVRRARLQLPNLGAAGVRMCGSAACRRGVLAAARARRERASSRKVGEDGSGMKSWHCQHLSTGFSRSVSWHGARRRGRRVSGRAARAP
jgi:hypothetical protein